MGAPRLWRRSGGRGRRRHLTAEAEGRERESVSALLDLGGATEAGAGSMAAAEIGRAPDCRGRGAEGNAQSSQQAGPQGGTGGGINLFFSDIFFFF